MTHIDMFQTSKFLSRNHRAVGGKLRRQLAGAGLFLVLGGGYAL